MVRQGVHGHDSLSVKGGATPAHDSRRWEESRSRLAVVMAVFGHRSLGDEVDYVLVVALLHQVCCSFRLDHDLGEVVRSDER